MTAGRQGRRLNVSREVLEADGTSLGLFTRKDSLSTRSARSLTYKLNTTPQYKEVVLPRRGRVYNEVPIFQIGPFMVTQSDFSKLRRCEWLNDNIIDVFLRRYVQEMIPRTFCFMTHGC